MPAKKKAAAKKAAAKKPSAERVVVRTPNVTAHSSTVDKAKYDAMRAVLAKVIPKGPPGVTQNEMIAAATHAAPAKIWPGGEKVGWWVKCVQLDQEAQGLLKRDGGKPLRWYWPR